MYQALFGIRFWPLLNIPAPTLVSLHFLECGVEIDGFDEIK